MSKENKIIKYNLQPEVDILLDQGVGLEKIASIIQQNHNDIIDLQKISHMCVKRYIEIRDRNNINNALIEGRDPVDEFIKEYRTAIKNLLDKTEKLYKESELILEEAKATESIQDKLKAIKEIRDNLEQERKSWVSLVQYGIRQTSNIYNINLKKEQNTKIMLLEWTKDLCPSCKDKKYKELSKENVEKMEDINA